MSQNPNEFYLFIKEEIKKKKSAYIISQGLSEDRNTTPSPQNNPRASSDLFMVNRSFVTHL
jgi:hypothetical protein